jgi:hypothetical protein
MLTRPRRLPPNIKDPSTWYTVGETARLLKCSTSTVQRYGGRELHPLEDDRGCKRYNPVEVRALIDAREQSKVRRGPRPGEIAARAFLLFDGGHSRRDVVTEMMITPSEAQDLWREWRTETFEEAEVISRDIELRQKEEKEQREYEAQRAKQRNDRLQKIKDILTATGGKTDGKRPNRRTED